MKDPEIKASLKWWNHKRIWFNLILFIVSVLYIIDINPTYFGFNEIFGIFAYGFVANVFFTIGFNMEVYDLYYLNGKIKIHKYRWLLLILGTLFSLLVTIFQIEYYYFGLFMSL